MTVVEMSRDDGAREPERSAPYSEESEKAVIGALFMVPRLLPDLADVRADEFLKPIHREILEAMREVDAVDPIAVAERMKQRGSYQRFGGLGVESYFVESLGYANPVVFDHHLAIVRERAVARRLIATCAETMARAYGGADMEELLPEHRRQISSLDVQGGGGPIRIGDALDPALEQIEKKAANPDGYQIKTGLADFDHVIGGVRAGQLVIVAAQPGFGKSAFAEQVAIENAKRGIPVLVFSLEMLRQELIERALSSESGINGRKIVTGKLDYSDWRSGLLPAAEKLRGLPIWIDDRRNLTHTQICAEARRWREKFTRGRLVPGTQDPDDRALVEIDYLGLVRSADRTQNREREVAAMSSAFKGLAGELGLPLILISQLNRGSAKEARKPVPSDLRDSGAVEADADMIIFPWRDPLTEAEAEAPPEIQEAAIIVAKHRNGPTGEIPVRWRPSTTQFLDKDFERFTGGHGGQQHFTDTDNDR
ncbi:MAG: hypothetical protein EPN98_21290 [Phenylobacterium sp.]|uniref:replicative DNA helicase n=1 Tax=Phenylobacterium sp. TaxID=1871053 RepID=UPI001202F127|nr:DnaB-like helicase C-terminal domain-containing protein [Phenylobacterium sp.]TAL28979.1 MAG: hypothetical protein EPN98_21290 [Phenylobacterium sp.]